MSSASAKGYAGEHAVDLWYTVAGLPGYRPRTTSLRATDLGDFIGPPWVTSVKNHKAMDLARWCDELAAMVARSPWQTGLVIHKRPRQGHPDYWYGTAPLALWKPVLLTYASQHASNSHPLPDGLPAVTNVER